MSVVFGPVFPGIATVVFCANRESSTGENWYIMCRTVTFSNETYQLISNHASRFRGKMTLELTRALSIKTTFGFSSWQ
jgi:hypothetical protein